MALDWLPKPPGPPYVSLALESGRHSFDFHVLTYYVTTAKSLTLLIFKENNNSILPILSETLDTRHMYSCLEHLPHLLCYFFSNQCSVTISMVVPHGTGQSEGGECLLGHQGRKCLIYFCLFLSLDASAETEAGVASEPRVERESGT